MTDAGSDPILEPDVSRHIRETNDATNRWVRRLALLIAAVVVVLTLGSNFIGLAQRQVILDCTTAGSHKPTASNPNTGHPCYDRGQRQTGAVVGQLVVADACIALAVHHEPLTESCKPSIDELRRRGVRF